MNAREQLLKKRVESLEGQLKVSMELLGRVLEENEYLSSVACAFAWDFQATEYERYGGEHSSSRIALEMWASAVEEASK